MGTDGVFVVSRRHCGLDPQSHAKPHFVTLTRNLSQLPIAPFKKGQSDGHRRGFAVAPEGIVIVLH
jgi:hypothetical protein